MNFKHIFQLLLIISSGESLASFDLTPPSGRKYFRPKSVFCQFDNQNNELNKRTSFQHKIKTIVKQKTPDMGSLARILGQAAASHHEK